MNYIRSGVFGFFKSSHLNKTGKDNTALLEENRFIYRAFRKLIHVDCTRIYWFLLDLIGISKVHDNISFQTLRNIFLDSLFSSHRGAGFLVQNRET